MTRRAFARGSRDKNESKITEILRRFQVDYCLMPPTAGFDLLVFTSPLELWEVKSDTYKWSLTRAEQERKDFCRRHGIIYRVIETIDQAVDALNSKAERQTK